MEKTIPLLYMLQDGYRITISALRLNFGAICQLLVKKIWQFYPFTICPFYYLVQKIYRTRTIINRGYYFFLLFCDVGFSLMFGGIPLKLCGH